MDSRLDRIFRTGLRQTESADAWMGIRRENPQDDARKQKKNDDAKTEKPAWEEETTVSVAALRKFLLNLIAPSSPYQVDPAHTSALPAQEPSLQQKRAHNAAQAYQSTARTTEGIRMPAPATPAADNTTLSAEENRAIHQLLKNLDVLTENGIATLTIQKEGSFLQSLSRSARALIDTL